jgi:hypothetical protein
MMTRTFAAAVTLGFLTLAGCGDHAAGPVGGLSQEDAALLNKAAATLDEADDGLSDTGTAVANGA